MFFSLLVQYITLAEAYYNRGIANYYLENFQGALEDLNGALQINPNNTKSLIARGIIYSALGAIEEAVKDYNKVLKINPNNYHAYFNRAVVYSIIGNKQKAIYDYNRALQINPDKADAYYNRGNIHHQLADNDKAIEDFKKAADIYKQISQEIDYQDAVEKIKSLNKSEYTDENRDNKTEINFPQNYVNYSFDVLVQYKDIWKQLLQDIITNINSRWQIVSIKNKKFIRIQFYGNDEKCSMLSQKFQEYEESCLKNMKSDFDTDINIETTQKGNCIDNIDKEFNKISDNNYSAQFESDRYDGWLDCGYMNDIINPYEVY